MAAITIAFGPIDQTVEVFFMRQNRADFSADFDTHILVSYKHTFTFPIPITDP
jgi:hypothetical protein